MCPPSCLWRALPIRAVQNWIWWPSQSALERKAPWKTLPLTPQAASLWSFVSRTFTTYQRHTLSGDFPALAQVLCNGSIFTQCPISQTVVHQFRYADRATCDFSSLPPHLCVRTWLWPFHQPYAHIVVSIILSLTLLPTNIYKRLKHLLSPKQLSYGEMMQERNDPLSKALSFIAVPRTGILDFLGNQPKHRKGEWATCCKLSSPDRGTIPREIQRAQ